MPRLEPPPMEREESFGISNNTSRKEPIHINGKSNYKPSVLSNRRPTDDHHHHSAQKKQIRRKSTTPKAMATTTTTTTTTTMNEMEKMMVPLHQQPSSTAPTSKLQDQMAASGASVQTNNNNNNVIVLGYDISHFTPTHQFAICAGGTFGFTLIYGFLQELVIVNIAGRKFAVFLAACQFFFFSFWSLLLVVLRQRFNNGGGSGGNSKKECPKQQLQPFPSGNTVASSSSMSSLLASSSSAVVYYQFVGLSLIRALDVTVSNLSMKYLNYPARTLIKSSRVVFTMMLGIVIQNKKYHFRDYFAITLLVVGLSIFLHADSTSSAVFNPLGVFLLILSLTCDGIINNLSEKMMKQYGLTQDDYHLRLYSLSFVASVIGAYMENEIWSGIHHFFLVPGTVPEIEAGVFEHNPATWTVSNKIIVFFLLYMTGLFGGSCLGAITKRFGALAMTLTSTTRKAATMFVSFSLFAHNTCTWEHVCGIALYIVSLLLKGYNKAQRKKGGPDRSSPRIISTTTPSQNSSGQDRMLDDMEKA